MKSEEVSAITEDTLRREAESFGDILRLLREWGRIPAELIDGPHWDALTQRADELEATTAAFPFGFEMPLHHLRPKADLGVSILGGSRTAAAIKETAGHESAAPYVAGMARMLREMEPEGSALRRITGREFMLEYEIDVEHPDARPDPAIVLGSIGCPLSGDGDSRRYADLGVLLDAMARAARRKPGNAERRDVERVYGALGPDAHIETIGIFPARNCMIRLEINGLRRAREIPAFLDRAGWSGERPPFADTLQRLEALGAFRKLGAHLDVGADGFGPELGISLLHVDARPQDGKFWLDKASNWTALIAALDKDGLAVPEKLSALSRWPGARVVSGRFGVFVLVCGIHHFELVSAGSGLDQVKAYAYMFLRSMPRDAGALALLSR